MNAPHLIASIGWTLLNFVWQGVLIGCATASMLALLRNARPEQRYAIACAGLLACLAWPACDLVQLLQAGPGSADALLPRWTQARGAASGDAGGVLGGVLGWLARHLAWIVGAWAACAALLGLRIACGLAWVGRIGRAQATDAAWQTRLSRLGQRFGLVRHVRLRVVDGLASPVTAGWWRPVVLVPSSLLTGMAPDLLEALLAHELAHVARHDYLVNLAQNVIETLLFYHPAVWWISHRIRAERELVADGLAARRLGEPRRLARALSQLEQLQFGAGGLAQAAAGGDLAARIRRLVRPETQALHWKAALPVLALAVACFANAHIADGAAAARPSAHDQRALVDVRSCAKPHYPAADIAASHECAVDIVFLVAQDGSVRQSRIHQSSGYAGLDEAALTALSRCRFQPALRDGRAVADWTPVRYVWTLR